MGAGLSQMGTGKGGDRSNVDPLSAVIRGNDAAVPQEPKGGSDRVWGEQSFLQLLRDPCLRGVFMTWLEEHSAESLLKEFLFLVDRTLRNSSLGEKFWMECDDYNAIVRQKGSSTRLLQKRAEHVYKKYLRPGCSVDIVQLDTATIEEISTVVERQITPLQQSRKQNLATVFHPAMRKVFNALLFDYLPEFLVSQTKGFWDGVAGISPMERVSTEGSSATEVSSATTADSGNGSSSGGSSSGMARQEDGTSHTSKAASEPNLNANGPGGRMEDGSSSQAPNREPTAGPVAPHRMPRKRPGARCCSGGGGRAGGDAASKSASQGLLSTRSTHGDIAERGSVGDAGVPVGAAAQVKLRGGRAGPRQSWKQETRDEDPEQRNILLLEPIPRSDIPSANGGDHHQPHPQHQSLKPLKQNPNLDPGTHGDEERIGAEWGGDGQEDKDGRAKRPSGLLMKNFTGYTKPWRSPTKPRLSSVGSLSPINARSNHDEVGKQHKRRVQSCPITAVHEPELGERTRRSSSRGYFDDAEEEDDGLGIDTVLAHPLGLSLFRRFSSERFQDENILLWTEMAQFRAGNYAAPDSCLALEVEEGDSIAVIRAKRARLIYETYISETAEKQVNLSSKLRESNRQRIEDLEQLATASKQEEAAVSGITASGVAHTNIFEEVEREVLSLMKTNLWASFNNSKRHEFFTNKYLSHHGRRSGLLGRPHLPMIACRKGGQQERLKGAATNIENALTASSDDIAPSPARTTTAVLPCLIGRRRSRPSTTEQPEMQQAQKMGDTIMAEKEVRAHSDETALNRMKVFLPAKRNTTASSSFVRRTWSSSSVMAKTNKNRETPISEWDTRGRQDARFQQRLQQLGRALQGLTGVASCANLEALKESPPLGGGNISSVKK